MEKMGWCRVRLVLPPEKKRLVQSPVGPHTKRVDVPEWRWISTLQTQRWVQSKEQKLNKPHRWEIQCRDTSQCRSSQKRTHRSLLKTQIGADNPLPETQIGTDDTEKTPYNSDDTEWHRGSTDRHRMQQREVSGAHNLLKIMLPRELRTRKSNEWHRKR